MEDIAQEKSESKTKKDKCKYKGGEGKVLHTEYYKEQRSSLLRGKIWMLEFP